MTYEEFRGWVEYFNRRPYQWRDDNRTAMLLQAQGVKNAERLFESLQKLKQNAPERDISETLKTSGLLNRLKEAAKNNNIDWEVTDA